MKRLLLLIVTLGLLAVPMASVHAADLAGIKAQVSSYQTSGDISDSDFAAGLHGILTMAEVSEMMGNYADVDDYLASFRESIDVGELDLVITASAAADLKALAQ